MNTLSFQNENKTAAPEAAENSRLAAIKKWGRGAIRGVAAGAFAAGLLGAAAQPAEAQIFKVIVPISKNYDGGYSGSGSCPDGKWWSFVQDSWSGSGSVFVDDRLVGSSDVINAMGVAIENCGHPLDGWNVEDLKYALEVAERADKESCAGQKIKDYDYFCKAALERVKANILSAVK